MTTTSPAAASRWLSPGSAPTLLAEGREPLGRSAVGDDALDGRDGRADAGDLRLGLVAAADDAERSRAAPREMPRGDPARRAGSELPEPVRLDHGDELRRLGVEEADDERRALRRRRVELPAGEPEPAVGSRHVRERALGQAEPAARRDLDLARRHAPEARLDGVDRGGRLEQARRRRTSLR